MVHFSMGLSPVLVTSRPGHVLKHHCILGHVSQSQCGGPHSDIPARFDCSLLCIGKNKSVMFYLPPVLIVFLDR